MGFKKQLKFYYLEVKNLIDLVVINVLPEACGSLPPCSGFLLGKKDIELNKGKVEGYTNLVPKVQSLAGKRPGNDG